LHYATAKGHTDKVTTQIVLHYKISVEQAGFRKGEWLINQREGNRILSATIIMLC